MWILTSRSLINIHSLLPVFGTSAMILIKFRPKIQFSAARSEYLRFTNNHKHRVSKKFVSILLPFLCPSPPIALPFTISEIEKWTRENVERAKFSFSIKNLMFRKAKNWFGVENRRKCLNVPSVPTLMFCHQCLCSE